MIKLRKILLLKYIYIALFIISLLYLVIYINITHTSKFEGSEKYITGEVIDIKYQGNKMTLTLKSKENLIAIYYFKNTQNLNKTKNELSLGDSLLLEGELNKPSSNKNFYSFSYPTYLKYHNIYYIMKISEFSVVSKNHSILNSVKMNIKKSISNDKVGNYIKVFFLGDSTSFDLSLKEKFQKLGISHLFALSGTQVSFLITIFFFIFKNNFTFRKTCLVFLILLFYYLIIESCAAIDRALIFSLIFSINKTFNLEIKPLFLILLSLSILFFINPYYIYDIGFQYSTIISLVLILYMKDRKIKNKIMELLTISWVSFLVSLPISLYHFSYVNLLSVVYNLFYVPFINIIIFPLAMICFLFPLFSFVLSFFINIFETSVTVLSHIQFGYIVLAKTNILYYLLYFIIIFCYLYFDKKKKIFLLILLLIILIHYSYPKLFPSDRLYMIDVGQGDSFLITSNNKTMLIDTGGVLDYSLEWQKYQKNSKGKYVVTFLKQLGITKLDYLVLTHGDYDHAGEALTIMKEIKVLNIFFNNNKLNSLEKKIWNNSSNHYKLKEEDYFMVGNFSFLVLSNTYDDENDSSLVLYSTIYDKKILFMGDASIRSEQYILNNYELSDITILKVGHHGSRTSSSEEFIKKINPTYALISAGLNNKFNHPHQEVIKRLKENKTTIFNTSKEGMVMFDFTNDKIKTYSQ